MSPVIKVVQPSGILDSTKASQFRHHISDVVNTNADVILVDLKDVTFIDSSGLGALVVALKSVRAAGRKMYICSINAQIKMLFELTSMDRVFEVFADQEEFNKTVLSSDS